MSYGQDHDNEIIVFAETNFRNTRQKFGIKTDDRRRHVYILGKSGVGKTTLIENMILEDIYAGHGVGFVDPHGDSSEKILDFIPSNRINDVVYFNPADVENPIGFNVLEAVDDTHKHLIASGLMGVFKKIWEDLWSARMEYILNNAILALLDYPGSTLLGINRLLSDKEYRKKVILQIKDPVVKAFWVKEFARYNEKFATEAVAPIQNKVGQFLSASIIRNIVAQVKSTIDIRKMMDEGKIFIMNLSKGRIGEDASRLLGGMLITKLQLSAMERVDTLEKERKDFYLYVDEFQNFATGSFAEILSEARKYRLNLILAHQYIAQLDEKVRDAIFGNVGTHIIFRLGAADATVFEEEFAPVFTPEDLVNLANHDIYLKLMIDGAASQPFSARTLPPIGSPTGSTDKVIKVSRERYSEKRQTIEEKIERWWGFGEGEEQAPAPMPNQFPAKRDFRDAPYSGFHSRPEITHQPSALPGRNIVQSASALPIEAPRQKPSLDWSAGAKRPSLFTAVCAKCNSEVVSKFKPDPRKPFYCEDCLPIIKEKIRLQNEGPRIMHSAQTFPVKNKQNFSPSPKPTTPPSFIKGDYAPIKNSQPEKGISLSALAPRPAKVENKNDAPKVFNKPAEIKQKSFSRPAPIVVRPPQEEKKIVPPIQNPIKKDELKKSPDDSSHKSQSQKRNLKEGEKVDL